MYCKMPPPTDPGYEKQTLKERYIKTSVLEAYIKANLDDFGSAWALEVIFSCNRLPMNYLFMKNLI